MQCPNIRIKIMLINSIDARIICRIMFLMELVACNVQENV